MPKFLERKLKQEYGEGSAIPYKIMNKMGAMRGSKETAKGRAMERKHQRHMKQGRSGKHKLASHQMRGRDTYTSYYEG